ncbi:MAG TPA: DUF4113 domain-containing protein, partial [Pyrinomonadaceae bacterium]|nr:DUF4113 domain-containing protein [Pyrinomonadaceae bacterium]
NRFRPVPEKYFAKHSYRSVYHSDVTSEIYAWVTFCLDKIYRHGYQYRKAGVILTDLVAPNNTPLRLFEQRGFERRHKLNKLIDEVNYRYGRDAVRSASLKEHGGWQGKSEHRGNDSYHAVGRDTLGLGKTYSKSVRFL